MRILFITSTRIGDAILSTGLLNYLMEKHPKAQVTIACGSLAAPLFQHFPGLSEIIELKRRRFSYHWVDLWRRCVRKRWDIIVDLRGSALSYLLRCGRRYVWRSQGSSAHRVQQIASLFGLKNTPPAPTVWVGNEEIQKAERLLPRDRTYIGIGPAAHWTGKEWPQENFRDLLLKLTAPLGLFPNAEIVVFAAPHEKARIRPLVDALQKDRIVHDFSGDLSLLEVAACLKLCVLYVGNDSGLMHLSAACETPTVGLFGPSNRQHYAPWGSHCRFAQTDIPYEELILYNHLQESLLTSLSVRKVEETILDLLAHQRKKA